MMVFKIPDSLSETKVSIVFELIKIVSSFNVNFYNLTTFELN